MRRIFQKAARRRRKRIAGWVGALTVVISLVFCGGQIYAGNDELTDHASAQNINPATVNQTETKQELSVAELDNAAETQTETEPETNSEAKPETGNQTVVQPTPQTDQGVLQFAWHQPLDVKPVISSEFGERTSGFHHGVDLACDWGTMIRAVADGTVIESDWKNSVYGYTVEIDHGSGWRTRYAHCGVLAVETGEEVTAGQAIALVGSTGNSTGPHLHLELTKDGMFFDPLLLVPLAQ